jgi:hypothetical protein
MVMKSILTMVFLSWSLMVSATIYYVQDPAYNDNASDSNRGDDINYPWATWQKAFDTARPGDTVYFRGGTWYPRTDLYGSVTTYNPRGGHGYNGTATSPVCFFAYPPDLMEGNMPVLDCRYSHPSGHGHVGLNIRSTGHVKFKGLKVTNVRSWPMESGEMWCAGIMVDEYKHLTLEQMTVSFTGGAGVVVMGGDTLYLINCDSHNNSDTLDVELPGNDGDGFTIMHEGPDLDTAAVVYIHGCRAWNNADDGFGVSNNKQLDIRDCWAWNNGDLEGDGNGFKLRYSYIRETWKRKIYNCIAASNRRAGFNDLNLHAPMGPHMEYLNNSTYQCDRGFGSSPGQAFDCNAHPAEVIYRNNISFASTGPYPATFTACNYQYPTYVTQDHNTWVQTGSQYYTAANPAYGLMADDFVSLDTAQLRWPRQKDGSLPDIGFMQLKPGSDLVNAGVDVGLAYFGSAPDLGAHQRGSFSVELVSPEIYQIFRLGGTIVLRARVEGASESVDEVVFYGDDGETLLGIGEQVANEVWEYSWDSDEMGYEGFRAVAHGSQGETATSSILRVRVKWPLHDEGTEADNTRDCQIIPNPNDGLFYLELTEPLRDESEIQIISLTGQVMAVERMARNELIKEMDLSAFPPGMYYIHMMNGPASPCGAQSIKMIKN